MGGPAKLVGRQGELEVVDRILATLRSELGTARAVAVAGEPGIGKTRLLAELCDLGRERGHLVLAGRASEFERGAPFSVFAGALDEHLLALDPKRLARLGDELGTELGHVLPSLSAFADGTTAVREERYRAHRAMRDLLERLAAPAPLTLVLDDLHWADSASVELIGALFRRPPRAAVFLALGLRPRQATERLLSAVAEARRAGVLERLDLETLDAVESRELLGSAVEPRHVPALFEQSGGNPFYLEQLARSLHPGHRSVAPLATTTVVGSGEVPPAVAEALTEELRLLSAEGRLLLDAAAIAGDPFDHELAAAVASLSLADALEALDELARLDLVRRADVPGRFRFRHPLVRRAVYEATPDGWRLGAHARADRALAALGASVGARAHHVEQCARFGDPRAIALLREAGDASAQHVPESAARWYEASLRLLPEHDDHARERMELLESLVGALTGSARFEESRKRLMELSELVPDADSELQVRVTAATAAIEHRLGRPAEAEARLTKALERLPDPASPEAATLMVELTQGAFMARDFERMHDWAARARAVAERLGDRPFEATATAALAFAGSLGGRVAEAQVYCTQAATMVAQLSDEEVAQRLDGIAFLAGTELALERYHAALPHIERGIALGRVSGQGQLFPLLIVGNGYGPMMLGHLDVAADKFDGAIDGGRLSEDQQSVSWALNLRAWTAVLAGDLDTALRTANESVELAAGLGDGFVAGQAGQVLGWVLLEAGEPARCVETILAVGGPELRNVPATVRAYFLEVLVRALLKLDRVQDAERATRHAELIADELGLGLGACAARRARARLALKAGHATTAAELALASAAAAEAIDARIEAARSRALAGQALVAADDIARGVEELERAAAELDACGALRYRDAAERELRRLGRPFHRRRSSIGARAETARHELSARELEVAQLVRQGHTNREIAGELFLSMKTVESHLRNVFRKLGVSSRVSVAREMEAADTRTQLTG